MKSDEIWLFYRLEPNKMMATKRLSGKNEIWLFYRLEPNKMMVIKRLSGKK
jgi:hypothetical protein